MNVAPLLPEEDDGKSFEEKKILYIEGSVVRQEDEKTVSKSSTNTSYALHEISVLSLLKHRNIIELLKWEQKDKLVTMYLPSGTSNTNMYTGKKNVRKWMFDSLLAVHYLHSNQFVHGDIKPENFIIFNGKSDHQLKLIDFETAGICVGESKKNVISTPCIISPEKWLGIFNKSTDIWSLGITFYYWLTGYHFFPNQCDVYPTIPLKQKYLNCIYSYHSIKKEEGSDDNTLYKPVNVTKINEMKKEFPEEMKIILSMLSFDPIMRPTTIELLFGDLFKHFMTEDIIKEIISPPSIDIEKISKEHPQLIY